MKIVYILDLSEPSCSQVERARFDRSTAFTVMDTVLHSLVEQNPRQTVRKFIRYNLPKIIEEILRRQ